MAAAVITALGVVAPASAQSLPISAVTAEGDGAAGTLSAGTLAAGNFPTDIIPDGGVVDYALTTKYCWVGDERTIAWLHEGAVDRFEVEFEHVENRIVIGASTTELHIPFTPTRAGHWRVRVRAVFAGEASEWATSEGSGWWLFAWLKAPSF